MTPTKRLEVEPPAALPQNTTRRFAKNVMSLASVQLANMILPLITVPYLVRVIGPDRLGLLSFSQAYITYFAIFINYGFEISAVRSIAARRGDHANTTRVFNEVIAGKLILWAVATVGFVIITFSVPDFRAHLVLHICTYLSCVGTVLFPLWLYQAMEDLGRVALFNLLVRLIFSAGIFVLIRRPEDYIYQTLSISVAQIVVSVAAFVVAMKRFKLSFTWPRAAALRRRFAEDRTLFFSTVMITLYASSSTFLLGLRASPYSVGIFSAGLRFESIARTFVGLALNQAFFPIVAHAFGQSREEGLLLIRRAFAPLLVGLSLIALTLAGLAPVLIHSFYGKQFTEAVMVLRVASLLTVTIGVSNLLGFHVMLNLRMDRAFFFITGVGSVIGMTLTYFLVGPFQHLGAAYAWVITEAYITVAMYVFLRTQGIVIWERRYFGESLFIVKQQFLKLARRS